MSTTIRPVRVNHINVVLESFAPSVAHFQSLYDAEFVVDIPQREMHAALIAIGGVIFELFVPHEYLLNARYGPHYLGIEYQADMAQVRAAIAERKMRIVRDIGLALHTHPQDGFGTSFEFYGESFHERDWPALGGPIRPAAWWRAHHPLGLDGLKAYSIAVFELEAATRFLKDFLGAEPVYDEPRPALAARAIGLQAADCVIELLAPAEDGKLREHLHRHGQGIYSTIFSIRDRPQAQHYFTARGISVAQGSAAGRLAIPAAQNLGLRFEFEP